MCLGIGILALSLRRTDSAYVLREPFSVLGDLSVRRCAESESPGAVAMSQESESESINLPRLRLRNALFESVL